MDAYPSFDALYAVSDLHLGGEHGFRIFDRGELLERALASVAGRERNRDVVLVVNGDIVDFLAEPAATHWDSEAHRKLARIINDPAFAPVFRALASWLNDPRHQLVLVGGNHDVELAQPRCSELLITTIAGDAPERRVRLMLALDGTGFTAKIGGRGVHCVHGNDVDDWNVVDHERVRRAVAAERRGVAEDVPANAGTRLVLDAMNPLKRTHPFVDVLKPETVPVALVLAAIDPQSVRRLPTVVGAWLKQASTSVLRRFGLLSRREESGEVAVDVDEAMAILMGSASGEAPVDLLAKTERRYQSGERVAGLGEAGVLGGGAVPKLRNILERYVGDAEYARLESSDETSQRLVAQMGDGIDAVIAGHTHLRKLFRDGGRVYINTGTWARLLCLDRAVLSDAARFAALERALASNDPATLDEWLTRRPTVACVRADATTVRAELLEPSPDGTLGTLSAGLILGDAR